MERKIVIIVHISLDGYVANEKGNFEDFEPGTDNLDFVCSVAEQADTVLCGRTSYQMLQAYWPHAYKAPGANASEIRYSNWYNSAKKVVVSTTLPETEDITVIRNDIPAKITALKKEAGKNIVIFGSPALFRHIVSLDLIDEYRMIVYPVMFGKGIPLFPEAQKKVQLRLSETTQLANGEMVLTYVKRK